MTETTVPRYASPVDYDSYGLYGPGRGFNRRRLVSTTCEQEENGREPQVLHGRKTYRYLRRTSKPAR